MDTTTSINLNATLEEVSNFTALTIDKWTEDIDCSYFTTFIYLKLLGPVVLLGLLGNALSFIVLWQEKQNSVSMLLLRSMAVCDSLFLAFAGTCLIFPAMMLYLDPYDPYHEFREYMIVILWPMVHTTHMLGIWSTVLIAVNRYIAIVLPYRAARWCSMNIVRWEIGIMVLCVFAYNLPHWFEFKLVTDHETNTTIAVAHMTQKINADLYTKIYLNAGYGIFVFGIPMVILIFCYAALC